MDAQIYVECGADLVNNDRFPFTRKHYFPVGQSDPFRWKYNNAGVYETVMQYINPVWMDNGKGKNIINARESLKYGDLYLDFDTLLESDDDFNKIKDDVRNALRYLKIIMSIEVDQVQFFYSGNKGIHLVVNAAIIGIQPHQALNQIYKEIASDIAKYCPNETLDVRVYDDKRMFRMVNSFNISGQCYKIPITFKEFSNCSLEQIRQLAQQPRIIPVAQPIPSSRAKAAMEKYIKIWTEKVNQQKTFQGKFRKLDKLPKCIDTMQQKIFRQTIDSRNNSATALASFYMQQGIERPETLARMHKWNEEQCLPPLQSREIDTIVHSIYNGQYRYGCDSFHNLSGVCEGDSCPLFRKQK